MIVNFEKYQGTGNDFIIIDNRDNNISLSSEQIKRMCNRRFGIGADGLMFLEYSSIAEFKMVYYNSDGNPSSLCGNGARCLVHFAYKCGEIGYQCSFEAADGLHEAFLNEKGVSLKMNDVSGILKSDHDIFLNTGSPHLVLFKENIEKVDVFNAGCSIRNEDRFAPGGSNVNFAQVNGSKIKVRTYERGVEDETLSCGTGVTAVAIAAHASKLISDKKVLIETKGGNLYVRFEEQDGKYSEVYLQGPATYVFKGEYFIE